MDRESDKFCVNSLLFTNWITKDISYLNSGFTFLNKKKEFKGNNIDWGFNEYGKLWTYNLNYMDYINQENIEIDTVNQLIQHFIDKTNEKSVSYDPYPISLRGINWIKFFSRHNINIRSYNRSLFNQYNVLISNLEYHLLGNHLLENGFSLLFAAIYFKDEKFYKKAINIIRKELNEQILNDGGHFELSPMYHQIILDRLLDSINLIQNNQRIENQNEFLLFLKEKASLMLSWLMQMTFSNGDIPHFNDSTSDVAPNSSQIFDYAKNLNIKINKNKQLSDSGYRKFKGNNYECIIDVGPIGPDYIPGHAHADMLSYVLYIDRKPFIIDSGISSYEKNQIRQNERSTNSHNTVCVNNKNQSDVWGGFRVGKRANIKVIIDKKDIVEAEHNGYRPIIHKRKFAFSQESIIIEDSLSDKKISGQSHLHFHPDRDIQIIENYIVIDEKHKIIISGFSNINIVDYKFPISFNKYKWSKKVLIGFKGKTKNILEIN